MRLYTLYHGFYFLYAIPTFNIFILNSDIVLQKDIRQSEVHVYV